MLPEQEVDHTSPTRWFGGLGLLDSGGIIIGFFGCLTRFHRLATTGFYLRGTVFLLDGQQFASLGAWRSVSSRSFCRAFQNLPVAGAWNRLLWHGWLECLLSCGRIHCNPRVILVTPREVLLGLFIFHYQGVRQRRPGTEEADYRVSSRKQRQAGASSKQSTSANGCSRQTSHLLWFSSQAQLRWSVSFVITELATDVFTLTTWCWVTLMPLRGLLYSTRLLLEQWLQCFWHWPSTGDAVSFASHGGLCASSCWDGPGGEELIARLDWPPEQTGLSGLGMLEMVTPNLLLLTLHPVNPIHLN